MCKSFIGIEQWSKQRLPLRFLCQVIDEYVLRRLITLRSFLVSQFSFDRLFRHAIFILPLSLFSLRSSFSFFLFFLFYFYMSPINRIYHNSYLLRYFSLCLCTFLCSEYPPHYLLEYYSERHNINILIYTLLPIQLFKL